MTHTKLQCIIIQNEQSYKKQWSLIEIGNMKSSTNNSDNATELNRGSSKRSTLK